MVAVINYWIIYSLFMSTSAFSFTLQRTSSFTLSRRTALRRLGSNCFLPQPQKSVPSSLSSPTAGRYYSNLQQHAGKSDSRRASLSLFSTTTTMASTAKNKNNGRIIMVLSPAKTMDLRPLSDRDDCDNSINYDQYQRNQLCDAAKTKRVCNEMKGRTVGQLKQLLGLSDSLARMAHAFWTDFKTTDGIYDHTAANDVDDEYRPAMHTFSGPAFQGLSPSTCDADTLSYLALNLFILDPVYGVLPSLQGMQPYRLEMGCKLIDDAKEKVKGAYKQKQHSLAMYWRDSVTRYLGAELNGAASSPGGDDEQDADDQQPPRILVNLASEEYSASIHPPSLPANTVFLNVVFRHKGKVVAVHAKRARGLMARYIAERGATTLDDVSGFGMENYRCASEAEDGTKWKISDRVGENVQIASMIFEREDAPPKPQKAGKKRAAATTGSKKGEGGGASSRKTRK
mmetsp:Transcript_796/g.1369  ORF Transcript_796/g.1369 Transcript_796/m.1369 type:complete len:456 (-) Transcript_796:233-1600(-)